MSVALTVGLLGLALQTTPTAEHNVSPGEYRVGAGDILEVRVFGNAELSLTPTVQPDGAIVMPLVKRVSVAGLTVAEIQRKLTNLLERDFLVDPQVEVVVKEFQSQFAIVVGEVNSPGRFPLRGQTRLIDLLVAAGGFRPSASAEVAITRTEGSFESGETRLRLNLGRGGLTPQDEINLSVLIRHGDVVTALGQRFFVVEGEVNSPGRYVTDGTLTVSGAIAMAGGTARFAGSRVRIRRVDSDSGDNETIEVDLGKVRKGQDEDVVLLPGDVVTVTRKRF